MHKTEYVAKGFDNKVAQPTEVTSVATVSEASSKRMSEDISAKIDDKVQVTSSVLEVQQADTTVDNDDCELALCSYENKGKF